MVLDVVSFIVAAGASLASAYAAVRGLERLGRRFGATPALLGLLVALAADGPEITSAVTALAHHQPSVGTGVVLGSNAFNLAALIGLGAMVSGRVSWPRPVLLMEGMVGTWVAVAGLLAVTHGLKPEPALVLAAVAFVPYVGLSVIDAPSRRRLPLPDPWREWLAEAVAEEEAGIESAAASSPSRPRSVLPAGAGRPGVGRAGAGLAAAVAAVIGASVVMERSASAAAGRLHLSSVVLGAVVLAAVTSLPNAVGGIYLARRGMAAALLSEAFNSNALNILAGLLVPAAILSVGPVTPVGTLSAAWGLGMGAAVLAPGLIRGGVGRAGGLGLVVLYAAFVVLVCGPA